MLIPTGHPDITGGAVYASPGSGMTYVMKSGLKALKYVAPPSTILVYISMNGENEPLHVTLCRALIMTNAVPNCKQFRYTSHLSGVWTFLSECDVVD